MSCARCGCGRAACSGRHDSHGSRQRVRGARGALELHADGRGSAGRVQGALLPKGVAQVEPAGAKVHGPAGVRGLVLQGLTAPSGGVQPRPSSSQQPGLLRLLTAHWAGRAGHERPAHAAGLPDGLPRRACCASFVGSTSCASGAATSAPDAAACTGGTAHELPLADCAHAGRAHVNTSSPGREPFSTFGGGSCTRPPSSAWGLL